MITATLISKIFLDAIGCFIVGIFFSSLLLLKQFETTRRLIAYIPPTIGSILIISTGLLVQKSDQVLELSFPEYVFIPFAIRIDSTHALILTGIGFISIVAIMGLLRAARSGCVRFSTAVLGILYNASVLLLVLVDTTVW